VILRRFVALLLAVSMIHLNSLRADSACADHGERSQPTAAHHGAMDGSAFDAHTAVPTQHERCDTPTLPTCCQMLASCSTLLGGHSETHVDCAAAPHGAIAAAIDAAPESRVASPDPPPPRS
jgi:hypothetical protein